MATVEGPINSYEVILLPSLLAVLERTTQWAGVDEIKDLMQPYGRTNYGDFMQPKLLTSLNCLPRALQQGAYGRSKRPATVPTSAGT